MKHRIIAAAVLAAVLCLALLAACGSGEPTRKDYEAIKEGTPRSEVLEKFGDPDSGLSGFFGIHCLMPAVSTFWTTIKLC